MCFEVDQVATGTAIIEDRERDRMKQRDCGSIP
jgi:hypothetical protein